MSFPFCFSDPTSVSCALPYPELALSILYVSVWFLKVFTTQVFLNIFCAVYLISYCISSNNWRIGDKTVVIFTIILSSHVLEYMVVTGHESCLKSKEIIVEYFEETHLLAPWKFFLLFFLFLKRQNLSRTNFEPAFWKLLSLASEQSNHFQILYSRF